LPENNIPGRLCGTAHRPSGHDARCRARFNREGDATASQASGADVSFQQSACDINQDYGFCDHDVTNVFNGYLMHDLPFGRRRAYLQNANKLVNAVAGLRPAKT
jgi:hypothetical protein